MKNTIFYLAFTILLGFTSCSEQDEYLQYIQGGEIIYTGKIDSVKVLSGKNRVRLEGLIMADPKVSELRVFWNNRSDSVVVPIERSADIDTVRVLIDNLPENIYNFEVRTYDSFGNRSIAVNSTGQVYGERYQQSLYNRPISSDNLVGNQLVVNYAGMDRSSGVIGTELSYEDSTGEEQTIFTPIDSSQVLIEDFASGTAYEYRTLFLPEPTAIDTFYTDYETRTPIPTPVLRNASVPFQAASIDGRWGNLAEPWITNEAIKVHNGHGGWDEWNGNIFNVESGWGAPAITNGKIYQTVEVIQPSTFVLRVHVLGTNHQATDEGGAYFVITKGEGLPNVEELESAPEVLNYKRVLESSPAEYRIEFTTEEPNQIISVGYLTTQADGWPGRFANITSWEIIPKN